MTTNFISRSAAIRIAQAETGLSKATCAAGVKGLPTVKDNKREKVSRVQLRRLINELSREPKVAAVNIRPLSARHRQAAREYAETN